MGRCPSPVLLMGLAVAGLSLLALAAGIGLLVPSFPIRAAALVLAAAVFTLARRPAGQVRHPASDA
nr:hypothetical protein [Rhodoferax sp.]